ncbi:MAG TPA: DUF192 domain-containing protein [bacterium]|jgi:uncharacterized membrane protein (UPF0127 family)|nr:DUF192 domain-containing protein [bacterium]HNT66269.1 DUF192 domain-containing protein [bacterium]
MNPVHRITFLLIAVVAGWAMLNGCEEKSHSTPSPMDLYQFSKQGELRFLNASGDSIARIDIEIADSENKIILGLMFRRSMREDQGMLFIFAEEDYRGFWMKNTYFSLDMLFIDSQGIIRNIHRNTLPLSENVYPSEVPVQYVLEVVAGYANRHLIQPGFRVEWETYVEQKQSN